MKISTKGIYALRIMTDMANSLDEIWTTSALAEKNYISAKYLEKIVSKLLKGGLLKSYRGSSGGYKLAKTPDKISIGDILTLTEGKMKTVSCVSKNGKCDLMPKCLTAGVWLKLDSIVNEFLSSTTLEDVIKQSIK